MRKTLFLATTLMANFVLSQTTYQNGGLSTGTTSKNGTTAPAGYTWSELQNNNGNTTESNSSLGLSGTYISSTTNFFLADDFIIPTGEQWQITNIDFFAYQTAYAGTTSPFNKIRVNIFSSDPSVAGAVSVFGDDTTNRFGSSIDSKMYRTQNTSVPANSNPGTTRKIWKVTANTPTSLTSGTYWIKFQLENVTPANGGFVPPVTIDGSRGLPTFNAKSLSGNGTWTAFMDSGNPPSAPDVPVDIPFIITYTTSALGTNELLQYDNRIQVYPNPVLDEFKINIPENLQVNNIEVIDMSGKLVKNFKLSQQYNVSDLPKGNYIVKIKSNEITKVSKFIKK